MNDTINEVEKLIHIKMMGDKSAESAVESLSQMLGMEVDMNVSGVNMTSIYSIPQTVGSKEVVGLYSRFSGPLSGTMLCLLSTKSALELSSILLGDFEEEGAEESDILFSEMQKSAVLEISNIITSAFIDVWANSFSIELSHNPPVFGFDFADAIIDHALIKAAKSGDFVIMFNNTLSVVDMDIDFNTLMLPDPGKLQSVFDLCSFSNSNI